MGGFAEDGHDLNRADFGHVETEAGTGFQFLFELFDFIHRDENLVANGIGNNAAVHGNDGLQIQFGRGVGMMSGNSASGVKPKSDAGFFWALK